MQENIQESAETGGGQSCQTRLWDLSSDTGVGEMWSNSQEKITTNTNSASLMAALTSITKSWMGI